MERSQLERIGQPYRDRQSLPLAQGRREVAQPIAATGIVKAIPCEKTIAHGPGGHMWAVYESARTRTRVALSVRILAPLHVMIGLETAEK